MSLLRCSNPSNTLILPVYNGGAFLEDTLRESRRWLSERPEPWELILVDDASRDSSRALIAAFVKSFPRLAIRRVQFESNRGKGFAVRTGLALARGSYAVFTDCDLAYDLDNVPALLARLDNGADAAIACRVLPSSRYTLSPSFFSYLFTRHLLGRAFNLVCRGLTLPGILDTQAGLKAVRTAAVRPILRRMAQDGFSFDVELLRALLDNHARINEVPVHFRYDSEPSTVAFALDSLRMLNDLVRVRARSLAGRYRIAETESPPATLVIHADDFGISPGVNRAIEQHLLAGAVTSTSVLAGLPHAGAAVAWAAAHPEYDYGVHLNLTLGRPVLPPVLVPSLVDSSGRFRSLRRFLIRAAFGRVRLAEIVAEWNAQIDLVRAAGVRISHLDSHQHVHLIPAVFRGAMVPVSERLGLYVRAMDGPRVFAGWSPDLKGWALALATLVSFGARPRPRSPFHGSGTPFTKRPTVDVLRQLLARMAPGESYELVVHPGFVDRDLIRSGDSYIEGRAAEQEVLASDDVRAVLRQNEFRLVGFPAVRRAAYFAAGSRMN